MSKPSEQDEIERNIQAAESLKFDLTTAHAVRTKSTEILSGVVADYLAGRLEALLTRPSLTDAQMLSLTHEIRGALKALGDIGDSVRRAHQYVARKTVRERIGLSSPQQEEL